MHRRRHLALAVLLFAAALLRADDPAARVVILVNASDPDSLEVARHYAKARGVPAENLVALPMSAAETIGWPEFVQTIWSPLQAELVQRKWIDAIAMTLVDATGRRKYAVSGHRIAYLVVCRGVPLRIMHDPQFYAPSLPFTEKQEYRTNAGAVDAELALLAYQNTRIDAGTAAPNYPINAFVPNPLWGNDHPVAAERAQVVKVSRLDGPTTAEAMALVDRAIAAERTGLLGRAYVDIGGNSPVGDRWFESVAAQLAELGFDTDVDRARTTFPRTARFDAPVLYFGWYARTVEGPFTLPGFQFPPGAIALHLHSYSAETLRSPDAHWCGPLIARGVTATVGNVFEPYLALTHRPDLLLRALARGETWGDAVMYSLPALSWQAVAIGDPLYRPLAAPFETQWAQRAQLPPRLAGYAALRKMNQLEAAEKSGEARAVALAAQHDAPSFAVGYELARRLHDAGDNAGAAAALGFAPLLESFRPDEWGLAREAAAMLAACGRPAGAMAVYRAVFRGRNLPRELRLAWLPEARAAAAAAGDAAQAERWRRDLAELSAAAEQSK